MPRAKNNVQGLRIGVTLGSIVTAFAASLCCFGPVLLAVLGIGSVRLIHKFTILRPYVTVVMLGLLGFGFYLTYRKKLEACEPGQACAKASAKQWNKVMVWVATVFVILFWAFPYYSSVRPLQSPY